MGPDIAFVESEDVSLQPVRKLSLRSGDEYGDVYTLSLQTAHDVNGWVGDAVEGAGEIVDALERWAPGRRDGQWRVYGPYRDRRDRDLSWLLRLSGDSQESSFEAWVGTRSAEGTDEMDRLLVGEISIDENERSGAFTLDFDTIEAHPDMKRSVDRVKTYAGQVEIAFSRRLDSDFKHVDLDFVDFEVVTHEPVPDYFSAGDYSFHREAGGEGVFHLDMVATFQTLLWSGPERERMDLDVAWHTDGAGRATGQVRQFGSEGDLAHGDLVIEECFGKDGLLTWRDISERYAEAFPDYAMGDPSTCTIVESTPR